MVSASENTRGAVLMSVTMAAFAINDTFMKALLVDIPINQALFMRGLLNVAMVYLVVTRFVGPVRWQMPRRDWWMMGLRSVGEVGAALTFLRAISAMPLANASAILQTLPLVITIVSALVFRDPLGWRRMTAIAVGFAGVMLIVKPGTEGFNSAAIWALATVGFVTLRDLAARALSHAAPVATVTVAAAASVTLVAGVMLLRTPLVPLSPLNWFQLMGTASFVIFGYVISIIVMKLGDVSFVAPFRYTAILWSALMGLLFFGEWPDGLTLIGAGMIAATGIYTVLREQKIARAARAAHL